MTRLYSFHCEPIIAVMLISLFNYTTGSHGKAVIKRKAAKMNGVKSLTAQYSHISIMRDRKYLHVLRRFIKDPYSVWDASVNRIRAHFRLLPNFKLKIECKQILTENAQWTGSEKKPKSAMNLQKFETKHKAEFSYLHSPPASLESIRWPWNWQLIE